MNTKKIVFALFAVCFCCSFVQANDPSELGYIDESALEKRVEKLEADVAELKAKFNISQKVASPKVSGGGSTGNVAVNYETAPVYSGYGSTGSSVSASPVVYQSVVVPRAVSVPRVTRTVSYATSAPSVEMDCSSGVCVPVASGGSVRTSTVTRTGFLGRVFGR